ncbi:hypothetical protein [Burkholderia cenocepacia]|uniref:hypothetical protein n=1 Tax=Burkholderia cenocepacia TaxID=95486 RepID=UPI00076183E4|nr:hypothetical protein [Burkholderia cenocepacia]KWU23363.1 hypothetical protein AS149_37465 [Burkholderia cenocepacia]
MSQSNNELFFNLLGDFISKSHSEIASFVDLLKRPAESAFNADFSGPANTHATYRFSENGLVFTAETADKKFEIALPLSASHAADATITLTTKGEPPQHARLTGTDILDTARIPESFRSLHARLVAIIRQVLPEELLKSFSSASEQDAARKSEAKPEAARTTDDTNANEQAAQPEYSEYVVVRPGERNLRFNGKLVAAARSCLRGGRHFAYEVFQTPAGTLVGLSWGLSAWPNERTRVRTLVTKDVTELVDLFGHNPVAKVVYEQLGLNTDEVVA